MSILAEITDTLINQLTDATLYRIWCEDSLLHTPNHDDDNMPLVSNIGCM